MATALYTSTKVLPGRRLEISTSEFKEGDDVEVFVVARTATQQETIVPETMGVWDWLQSLPPCDLTLEDWERIEREMKEEKDAWGD